MYGTAPLADVLAEVGKIGADAIDVWPRVHADHREQMDKLGFDRVAELLDRFEVNLEVLTRFDLGPLRIHEELPTAKMFGSKLLICGSTERTDAPLQADVNRFVERMKPIVEQAATLGVSIGIENHKGSVIHTPESIERFAEAVDFPNFGLALSPYHLPQESQLIAKLIKTLGNKIVFFQAWQHGSGSTRKQTKELELQQLPGRGPLDFTPILAALKYIGYQGRTEIFMHPLPRGIPIHDTTQHVTAEINESRNYLEKCLKKLGA